MTIWLFVGSELDTTFIRQRAIATQLHCKYIGTSTLQLQYKFKVVRDTNEFFIPLTVAQGTANIAQKYQ